MHLPDELNHRLQRIFPGDFFRRISTTFKPRPTTFRVNILKSTVDEALDQLRRNRITFKRVPWITEGFILTNSSQNELEKTELYKSGKIWLQSLASMVPVAVLSPRSNERILDMTAAPGSKTSQIAAGLSKGGELHAFEIDKIRFERLKHTCKHLGIDECSAINLKLVCGNAAELLKVDEFKDYFDAILLDAPCSAEATIGSEGKRVAASWKISDVVKNSALQRKLLDTAWGSLKRGGRLIYSTCTFAPEENELQLSNFLKTNKDCVIDKIAPLNTLNRVPIVERWEGESIDKSCKEALRIVPNGEIEGFFIAKLKKV